MMVKVIYFRNYQSRSMNQQKKSKDLKNKLKTMCDATTQDVIETAHEYSQNSSLHGLRYVGNQDLHIIERYLLKKIFFII